MKYLCLVYYELDALSSSTTSCARLLSDVLRKSGHYVASSALQRVQTATTIRAENGKLSTTDGPFAETKEQLGGFVLIEARDLNDALQVAARIPPGRLGSIEVRPIQELVAP
jgi:hypothetical protein